jgi:hypothetical protein
MRAAAILSFGLVFGLAFRPAAAQTVAPADPRLARHRASLWAEAREVLERTLEAGAAARFAGLPSAAIDRARASAAALRALDRDLRGPGPAAGPAAQASPADQLADQLDLLPVPGLAAAGLEPPPSVALRVWLAGAWPAGAEPRAAQVSWISPEGERMRARRESLSREAFAAPGFDLYFRAPSGPAGRWWIELELEFAEPSAALPVARAPFDLVAGLEQRLAALGAGDAAEALRAELRLTETTGLRSGHGLPAEELLAALEGQLAGASSGWWRAPFAPAALAYRPAQAGRWGLLVAEPRFGGSGRWRGRLGERWRAWCERHGVLLIALETTELEECFKIWAAGRDGWPAPFDGDPLLLLPGGASLGLPALLSADPGRARWSFALEARGAAPPGLALPGVVLLGPQAFAASQALAGASQRFRAARESLLESELDWPLLLGDWPGPLR